MVRREITGFRQDDEGDWVAELDCRHSQHVRHEPPLSDRAWVTTAAGRAERIGTTLDCQPCDRGEMPDGLVHARTLGPLDETTVPAGLRRTHRLARAVWARLQVLDGSARFRFGTEAQPDRLLVAGDTLAIPPEVDHVLTLVGPVRLQIDFYRTESSAED